MHAIAYYPLDSRAYGRLQGAERELEGHAQ